MGRRTSKSLLATFSLLLSLLSLNFQTNTAHAANNGTTTTLTAASASIYSGATDTLTATVSNAAATGTVSFSSNGSAISGCTAVTVTSGVATCVFSPPSVGTYSSLIAAYSGDGTYQGSTSSSVSILVSTAPTIVNDASSSCALAVTGSGVTVNSSSVAVSVVGSNCVVKFLTVGTYSVTIPTGVSALNYLVVGGGGGGGSGGGGGGGVLSGLNFGVTPNASYTVTVGAGGRGGCGGAGTCPVQSANGSQSVFSTVTALGGGAGGDGRGSHAGDGASGGGARYDCTSLTCAGNGTNGQGTNGAASTHGGYGGGAGGGGAGGAGGNTILYHIGGRGGNGFASSITGSSVSYGGGGGGGINSNDNQYCGLHTPGGSDSNYYCNSTNSALDIPGGGLGQGGGGNGSSWGFTGGTQGAYSNATPGAANTGGGGGGTDPEDNAGGAGGSGVVILSYVAATNLKTITFNSNINTPSTSIQSVTGGISTQLQNNAFSAVGYIFSRWNTAADGSGTSYANLAYITTNSNLTLFAQWTAGVNNTVTFNANSGTGTMAAQSAGQTTNLSANLYTRSGYTFTGWNTASGGTGYSYSDQATYSFTSDVTLYAQWALIVTPHTVSFYGNGSDGGGTNSQTASTSQALTLNGFTRTNYNFLGWDTNNNAGTPTYLDGQTYSFTADLGLYAIWAAVPVVPNTVTFNSNGGSGTMANELATTNTVLSANTFTQTGYTFLNWNTAANGSGASYSSSYTYSFARSITLYAIWSQNLTISYDGNSSASGSTPTSQGYYSGGPTLSLANNPGSLARPGYTLTGWNSAANGSGTAYALGQSNVTFSTNTTLYAQWTGATYVILYTGNGNTGGSAPSFQSYVLGGSGITISGNSSSLARTGYTFSGWNTQPDGSGTAYTVGSTGVTFTQSTVLFAQWTGNQVTVTFDPGLGTVSPTSATFTVGSTALILPTPTRTAYDCQGWYTASTGGSLVGAVGSSYSPTSGVTLYAHWQSISYVISYDSNGGSLTDTSSITYNYGDSPLVLRTPTRTSFTFQGWYSATTGGTRYGIAGASFTPSATATLHAQWIQNSLVNLISPTLIGTITTTNGIGTTYTLRSPGTTVDIDYPANALPANTVISAYFQGDLNYAKSAISGAQNFLLSTVIAWLAPDQTVPNTSSGVAINVTITDPGIQVGAKAYLLVGTNLTLAATATIAGQVTVAITSDPEIVINNPGSSSSSSSSSGGSSSGGGSSGASSGGSGGGSSTTTSGCSTPTTAAQPTTTSPTTSKTATSSTTTSKTTTSSTSKTTTTSAATVPTITVTSGKPTIVIPCARSSAAAKVTLAPTATAATAPLNTSTAIVLTGLKPKIPVTVTVASSNGQTTVKLGTFTPTTSTLTTSLLQFLKPGVNTITITTGTTKRVVKLTVK